jgi:hypothetical protein
MVAITGCNVETIFPMSEFSIVTRSEGTASGHFLAGRLDDR